MSSANAPSEPTRPIYNRVFWDMFLTILDCMTDELSYEETLACEHAFAITNAFTDKSQTLTDVLYMSTERFREILMEQPEYKGLPPGWELHIHQKLSEVMRIKLIMSLL